MYAILVKGEDLAQGDIIDNVVMTYLADIADPSLIDIDGYPVAKDLSQPLDPQEELLVLGQVLKSPVLIVSQSCDVLRRPYICVARILPLAVYDCQYKGKVSTRARAKHIQEQYQRAGVQSTAFYLQESPEHGFPKSVASFLELHSFKNTPGNVRYLRRNRFLRLHPEAVEDLQFRIGYFFGRFAAIDDYMLTDEEKHLVRG